MRFKRIKDFDSLADAIVDLPSFRGYRECLAKGLIESGKTEKRLAIEGNINTEYIITLGKFPFREEWGKYEYYELRIGSEYIDSTFNPNDIYNIIKSMEKMDSRWALYPNLKEEWIMWREYRKNRGANNLDKQNIK
jgi:hypothetical protein